jgi:hypothetical protein
VTRLDKGRTTNSFGGYHLGIRHRIDERPRMANGSAVGRRWLGVGWCEMFMPISYGADR